VEQRYGITVPLSGKPFNEQREWIIELADLGYTDVWSAEVDNVDAFTPLVLASQWAPSLRLGTAIVPVYTRGPALIAQSAASASMASAGNFVLGIGASSNVIVVPARARHAPLRPHCAHRREGEGGLRDL
jgi:alkanesulfonate monooxygenase SsuD/methylene tetrahydromethanopterin reductase-like flavin-dependent oxidoreductase (luciferase family)